MDISTALPTFVVTLREGFEAALVVGIVFAYLQQAQKTQLYRWVYLGVIGGIFGSVVVGLFLAGILGGVAASNGVYAPIVKQFLEAIFGVVAVVMLSWMLIWMSQQAKSIKGEVESRVSTAIEQSGAGRGIFVLVFVAVLREGFETVLFAIAKFQQQWAAPAIGAISGLLVACLLAWLLFQGGVKLNLRLFFQLMGILLMLIVGGLVIGVFKHLDAGLTMLAQLDSRVAALCWNASDACILGPRLWDASSVLSDRAFPGIILKSLFGYRDQLYLVQAVAYVGFLAVIGISYFQTLSGSAPNKQVET